MQHSQNPGRRPWCAHCVAALWGLIALGGFEYLNRPPLAFAQTSGVRTRHGLDCDCPGCRSYVDACDIPCPADMAPGAAQPLPYGAMEPRAGGATGPQADQSARSQQPTPSAGQTPPVTSLAGSLGATAVALSSTPHMIGDQFGPFGGNTLVTLDRVFAFVTDMDALSAPPANSPFTVSEPSSAVAIVESFSAPANAPGITPGPTIYTESAAAEFTTLSTTAAVGATLENDPLARLEIVDNAQYHAIADGQLTQRSGATGQTQFNQAGSFARLQSGSFPMGGPGLGEDYDAVYQYDRIILIPIGPLGGAPGANVGRQKIAESGSPIPRDRIIANFSHFTNTPLTVAGRNVSRNVIGFEKTFFDQMASVELRVPSASTLDSTSTLTPTGVIGGSNAEFGNMMLYLKLLVWDTDSFATGVGLGVGLPTADDFRLRDAAGVGVLTVENESPHLLPYVGFVGNPSAKLFWMAFLQLDLDTGGNSVSTSPLVDGSYTGNLTFVDRLRDRDYLYADFSLGYWMFRNTRRSRGLTGAAPVFEVHYNGSIDRGDALTTDDIRTLDAPNLSVVNAVAGSLFQFGGNKNLTFSYATPLGGDKQFDGEFRMTFNWFFGASAPRMARYPF